MVESSFLISVLFRDNNNSTSSDGFSQSILKLHHLYISFFFIYFPYLFDDPVPSLFWWVGRNLNDAPSDMEPAKDLVLVHTVQLNPMIKAHSSGKMVSSGRDS